MIYNGRTMTAYGTFGTAKDAVLYTEQGLTPEQQAQARKNIGAAAVGEGGGTGSVGPQGPQGEPGKDGTSVTVSGVSESTEDGGSNIVTFSDGKTLTVKNGSTGSTGETGSQGDPGERGSIFHLINMEVKTVTDPVKTLSVYVETPKPNDLVITNDWDIYIVNSIDIDAGTVNAAFLGNIKGEIGPQGEPGVDGAKGENGATGAAGKDGITPQIRINATTNLWEISTDNGATWTSTNVAATGEKGEKGDTGAAGAKGEKGEKGDKGEQGIQGIQGEKGDKGDKGETGAPGGDYVLTDADMEEIAALVTTSEMEFAVEKAVENRASVCVVEETDANIDAADNSAYFSREYIVVQDDTYKVDKATMLSLQNKKLIGNGSVAWKDWDNILQGWKNTFDANMLSSALKVRYADDPVYLSMKLPSEANFSIDYVTRPGMIASDYKADDLDLVAVNNIAAIYAVDYESLPDNVVICIGNMSLYTLSKEPNAKWKLYDKCAIPEGYGMFSLPWNSANETVTTIPGSQISIRDDYIRFTLSKDDFSPVTNMAENSVGRALHFWGKHQGLDLSNNAAIITFLEVWTETEGVADNLYVAIGCDRKNSNRTTISQVFWGRNVLLDKEKKIIAGHNISDALYEELRDTTNDPRLVYADYASGHGSDYDLALLKSQVEKDLADKTVKMDACFSTLEITEVTNPGININPGVYETGYIASGGTDYDGYHDYSFRTKGYIKVEGGRTLALYYDKAGWNNDDNGKPFYIYEYDINKTFIRGTNVTETTLIFQPYKVSNSSYTLDANTVYIRICYNNWRAYTTPISDMSDIKVAIYYLEDARLEFVEYYADIEAVYGVKGDRIILTAPNGSQFSLSILNDGTLTTKLITG